MTLLMLCRYALTCTYFSFHVRNFVDQMWMLICKLSRTSFWRIGITIKNDCKVKAILFYLFATRWLTVSMMFCTSSNSMKCSNLSQPFSFRTKKNLKHGLNVFVVKAAQGKLCSWFHLVKQFEVCDSIWKYRMGKPSLRRGICGSFFLSLSFSHFALLLDLPSESVGKNLAHFI